MYSREQNNTTHSARHGAANTPEHSNHIYLPNSSLIGDPDTVAWHGCEQPAAQRRVHGSASRQPSSHSLHCITASNAALPSRKVEGLLGPLRPWSGSRSCGAPPRPRPLPFAHALRAAIRTLTAARARAVRVQPCHRILEATTMRRTAGIENWAVSLLGGGGGGKETLFIRKGTLFSYHKFCGCGNFFCYFLSEKELRIAVRDRRRRHAAPARHLLQPRDGAPAMEPRRTTSHLLRRPDLPV